MVERLALSKTSFYLHTFLKIGIYYQLFDIVYIKDKKKSDECIFEIYEGSWKNATWLNLGKICENMEERSGRSNE